MSALFVFAIQLAFIGALLVERRLRLRVERESRRNADLYRSVVETQTELICRFLPDTTLTFVNDAYCRFFDTPRDRLIGRRFIELIPESDRDAVVERIGRLASGTDSHQHRVLLPDGSIGWHHWINCAIVDEHGAVIELQAVGRDITELKRAQDAIGQFQSLNSGILRAIPDLMFVLRHDGTYLDYHADDDSQLYVPPSAFIGRKIRDVMPAPLSDIFMDALERVIHTDGPVVVEYELPLSGEPRYFEMRLVDAGGDRVLSIVRDITHHKRAEALNRDLAGRLIASQENLHQQIARELHDNLGQKVALVAIDIETLALASRKTNGRNGATPAQGGTFRVLSERIAEIASEIHDLSYELHPVKLQTLGLVPAVEALCRNMSAPRAVSVVFTHGPLPESINPQISLCIYRVVQEALHNVVRHSRARKAHVSLILDGERVVCQVSDSGVGFNPDTLTHSGLGLVSMRERAALVGGDVSIRSRAGSGTRVVARLPLEPKDPAWAAPVSQTA